MRTVDLPHLLEGSGAVFGCSLSPGVRHPVQVCEGRLCSFAGGFALGAPERQEIALFDNCIGGRETWAALSLRGPEAFWVFPREGEDCRLWVLGRETLTVTFQDSSRFWARFERGGTVVRRAWLQLWAQERMCLELVKRGLGPRTAFKPFE